MRIEKQYLLSLVFIILFQIVPTEVNSICQPNRPSTEWKQDRFDKKRKRYKAKRQRRDPKPITAEWVRRRAELSARFGTISIIISLILLIALAITTVTMILGIATILNGGLIFGGTALLTILGLVLVIGTPVALIVSFFAIYFGTSAREYIGVVKNQDEKYRILRLTARGLYYGWIAAGLAGLISVLLFL